MISSILKNVCINNGDQFTLPAIPKNWIDIEFVNEQQQQLQHNDQQTHSQMKTILPFSNSECFTVSKYNGKLLTLSGCDDVKEVYELNLDVSGLSINSYLPGDTIGILPENSLNDVNIIIQQLGYGKICDQNYRMMLRKNCEKKNAKLPIYLPAEDCSIRKLLKDSLDIHCVPKKLFLLSLINYIDDPLEQNFLKLLCSKEGTSIYAKEILAKRISFLELIKNVQTCRPPFHILLEHLPRLMPRVYSIANWQEQQQQHSKQNQLKIVFSLNYKNPGITTSMLKQYIVDTTTATTTTTTMAIYFYFRIQNKFQYNYLELKNSINSIIMIATGTGIAPFLSFLEYRKYQQQQQQQNQNEVNSAWLIYGCRYKLKNYLYSDMLQQYLTTSNVLTELSTAFSKDTTNSKDEHCKYVQHLIEKDSKKFMEFYLNENCRIYICGNPEMMREVNKTIVKLLTTTTTEQCSIEDAQMMFTNKKLNGNYIEDVWT